MPGIYYKDNATFRTITGVYYKDGSTFRTITDIWYKDGATLRHVFNSLEASITGHTVTDHTGGFGAKATFVLKSTGELHLITQEDFTDTTVANEWLITGTGADFQVRITQTAHTGGGSVVGTAGTWQTLSSDRTFGILTTAGGAGSYTFDVELRETVSTTVVDTASFTTAVM